MNNFCISTFFAATVAVVGDGGGCLMAFHFALRDRHSAVSVDTACRLACSFQ